MGNREQGTVIFLQCPIPNPYSLVPNPHAPYPQRQSPAEGNPPAALAPPWGPHLPLIPRGGHTCPLSPEGAPSFPNPQSLAPYPNAWHVAVAYLNPSNLRRNRQ
jgi:hypothetical protein